MERDDQGRAQAGEGIGREAGKAGGYGAEEPAELHRGTDVDAEGARRSDGLTGSGADNSADFTPRDGERATGTPAEQRRS